MEITKTAEGSKLSLAITGKIDTSTAPKLAEEFADLGGVTELALDFSAVDYISSAGLRVLLLAQKTMNAQGSMYLTNVNNDIKDVFEITGFSDILTVK